MQDPSNYFNNQFPEHEILKCPRCDSSNTKFCYYNNYNLSQPRHYCKNCKRYWTKGGTLRNIPVGGASRKIAKRSSSSSSSSNPKRPTTTTTADVPVTSSSVPPAETFNNSKNQNQHQQTFGGISTSTSPASYLIDSAYNQRMGIGMGMGGFGQMGQRDGVVDPKVEETSEEGRFAGLESGDISCWSGSNNDWPDLAIYTPGAGGSTFQ